MSLHSQSVTEPPPDESAAQPDELRMKGAMLVKLRSMTPEERLAEGWQKYPEDIACAEYDNGAILYSGCEHCHKPGTIYANVGGQRWGIDSTGEPYARPSKRKRTPIWAYALVVLAVLVAGLAATGVVTLRTMKQDQGSKLDQQYQIMREQRSALDRQLATQRRTERLIRDNQKQLERLIKGVGDKVDTSEANQAAMRQSYENLQRLINQRSAGGGGR